jgi:hypothetical protein
MSNRACLFALAALAVACGKPEPVAVPPARTATVAVAPAALSAPAPGTVSATATTTVRVAPKDDAWAEHRGDLPFVVGMADGLAKAKAAGRPVLIFYTQPG